MTAEQTPEPVMETEPEVMSETAPEPPTRNRWQRLLHWEFLGLILIVLTTLVFHFIAIGNPATVAWDEKYYVGDAR